MRKKVIITIIILILLVAGIIIKKIYDKKNEEAMVDLGIGEIIMDDSDIRIPIKEVIPKIKSNSKINEIKLYDLVVKDEQERILFSTEELSYNKNQNMNDTGILYLVKIGNQEIEMLLKIRGTNFPDSKKLNISFNKIVIYMEENKKMQFNKLQNGSREIDDIYRRRIAEIYNVKSCDYSGLDWQSIEAISYSDKMTVKIIFNENTDITETMNEYNNDSIENHLAIKNNAYIENDNGEKFYIYTGNTEAIGGYHINQKGKLEEYWQTFELKQIKTTENLKLILESGKGDKICIQMEK